MAQTPAIPLTFADRIETLRVKPSLPDHRDLWLFASAPAATLPPNFDLGVNIPIKDQRRQGSCTGHGFSSMMEALEQLAGKPYTALSRAYIYARERIIERDLNEDAGAMPIDGCKVLTHYGVCPETDMPYNDQVYNVPPTPQDDHDAAAHKALHYARVMGSLAARQATVMRRPIGFGIQVYESYEEVGADGVLPMPKPGEKALGGHWIFGNRGGYISDGSLPGGGGFWTQQSWGAGFAKSGLLLMPFAYLDDPACTFEIRAVW